MTWWRTLLGFDSRREGRGRSSTRQRTSVSPARQSNTAARHSNSPARAGGRPRSGSARNGRPRRTGTGLTSGTGLSIATTRTLESYKKYRFDRKPRKYRHDCFLFRRGWWKDASVYIGIVLGCISWAIPTYTTYQKNISDRLSDGMSSLLHPTTITLSP